MSAPILPAGVQPVVGPRGLVVTSSGLSLIGPLSVDAHLPAFADIRHQFQGTQRFFASVLTPMT
jgi:hypothetical protein